MYADGKVFRQGLLQHAEVRCGLVFLLHRLNLLFAEEGEDADIFLAVLVAAVEPELVKVVRGGLGGIEPDVALLGLTELAAVGLGDERTGEGEGLAVGLAANQLGAGGDVAPLVGAAHLQLAVVVLVQIHEVVTLHQLI